MLDRERMTVAALENKEQHLNGLGRDETSRKLSLERTSSAIDGSNKAGALTANALEAAI